MAYSKHVFRTGDKLFASQLNQMEEQIVQNAQKVQDLQNEVSDIDAIIGEVKRSNDNQK